MEISLYWSLLYIYLLGWLSWNLRAHSVCAIFASGPLIEWVQRAERKGMRQRETCACMSLSRGSQPSTRTFTRTPSKRHRWICWQLTTRNLSGAFGTPFLPPFKWQSVAGCVQMRDVKMSFSIGPHTLSDAFLFSWVNSLAQYSGNILCELMP